MELFSLHRVMIRSTLLPEFGRKTILVGEKEESDIQVINIKSDVLKTKFSISRITIMILK